ncbi:MAG: hypothetical protein ACP5UH_01750 [Candidatus Micrarchaeia archaeon]
MKAQLSFSMLVVALIALLFIGTTYQIMNAMASNTVYRSNTAGLYAAIAELNNT